MAEKFLFVGLSAGIFIAGNGGIAVKKPLFEGEKIEEFKEEVLNSVKAPKKDGKGYRYPVMGHLAGLENATRGDRGKLLAMAGY